MIYSDFLVRIGTVDYILLIKMNDNWRIRDIWLLLFAEIFSPPEITYQCVTVYEREKVLIKSVTLSAHNFTNDSFELVLTGTLPIKIEHGEIIVR